MTNLAFPRAILILERLLEGKTLKEVAYELDVPYAQVSEAKNKFPLFLGLPRHYKERE